MIETDTYIDDANIPVDIWLEKKEDKWHLHASNYMPRRSCVTTDGLDFTGTKEECAEIIQTKIIPLYETALDVLRKMLTGEQDHLYYWQHHAFERPKGGDVEWTERIWLP